MSLLSELKRKSNEILSNKVDLLTKLTYAIEIARFLKDQNELNWLNSELRGYDDEEIPEYRIVVGDESGLPIYHKSVNIYLSVNDLIKTIKSKRKSTGNPRLDYVHGKGNFAKIFFGDMMSYIAVEISQLENIINSVENRIIDFTIDSRQKLFKIEENEYEAKFLSGSLKDLKEVLVKKIFDFILTNPSLFQEKSHSITESRRSAIKERDKYICQLCQEIYKKDQLEIDHIFPYSLGGSNKDYNLMTLCHPCNQDKGKRLEYYNSKEGKNKIEQNIREYINELPMIIDFGKWLKDIGKKKRQ